MSNTPVPLNAGGGCRSLPRLSPERRINLLVYSLLRLLLHARLLLVPREGPCVVAATAHALGVEERGLLIHHLALVPSSARNQVVLGDTALLALPRLLVKRSLNLAQLSRHVRSSSKAALEVVLVHLAPDHDFVDAILVDGGGVRAHDAWRND